MSRDFRFKQFVISQSKAPMKVGTDGVLLGAWCNGENVAKALDIGTGTGLIAIMLAQRFPGIEVQAIEPNLDALTDAETNIKNCPWRERIKLTNASIQGFTPSVLFDLIVSNPPFFHNDLKATDGGRNMARHAADFDFMSLLQTKSWLTENGVIAGIYPVEIFKKMKNAALALDLHLHESCYVKPTPEKPAHRILFSFGKTVVKTPKCSQLVIESDGRHHFSDEYKLLTSPFYLKF